MAIADIQAEKGIPFLRLTVDEKLEQSVNTKSSRRRVPLHSSLIALGFLDYVKRIKAAGHVRLFPSLKKGSNGYSGSLGKYFARLVTKTVGDDPALVMHSLRSGGVTKLHIAGVPQNTVMILAGHAADDVHGQVYVKRDLLPMRLLSEALNKLDYSEVVERLREATAAGR